ncbi:hypothetical protein [Kitasatospora sp. McL0602]
MSHKSDQSLNVIILEPEVTGGASAAECLKICPISGRNLGLVAEGA